MKITMGQVCTLSEDIVRAEGRNKTLTVVGKKGDKVYMVMYSDDVSVVEHSVSKSRFALKTGLLIVDE